MATVAPLASAGPVPDWDDEDINVRCAHCGATAWAERPEMIAAHDCQTGDWCVVVMPASAV